MPLIPLGSNNPKNSNTRNATVSELKEDSDPLSEFDEYGTELHREARVWKVYVKETDKYDGDLVKGWNDSADVILVFAALFSAISSAFIIESSKMLQQDPLLVISQTLLSIANGTQAPGSISTSGGDSADFTPTRIAICVNTLWYLSLSLSLATSFVAILAKDWCHSFMKDRTGHPFDQTCRRQQKWDMIVRWKMTELLAFLPSLIHAALLLFTIGLCIMLWDTHVVVAAPVICVAGVAFAFYISSSIAASLVDSFPYPTIISRIYRTELRQLLWRLFCELPLAVGLILSYVFLLLAFPLFFIIIIPFYVLCSALDGAKDYISHRSRRSPLRVLLLFLEPLPSLSGRIDKLANWIYDNLWRKILDEMLPQLRQRIPKVQQGLEISVRLLKRVTNPGDHNGADKAQLKYNVSSQALSWLITSCEVPQSVDIALQSIAGATSRISRPLLLECKAPLQILRRLASSNLYRIRDTKSEAAVSLYVRALSFLGASARSDSGNRRKEVSKLETSIWDLQAEAEKKVAALIEGGNFEPTRSNLEALRIGSTVASRTLKLLQNELGMSDIVPVLDSIAELLKPDRNPNTKLHDAAVVSLVHAATLLLLVAPASIATRQNDSDLPPELLTICRNFPTLFGEQGPVSGHPLLLQCIRLAQRHPSGLIASLASTCILLHNTYEDQTRPQGLAWSEEVLQGLIHRYSQDDVDLKLIYNIEPPGISAPEETYDLRDYISRLDEKLLSNNPPYIPIAQTGRRTSRRLDEKVVSVELHALSSIYHLTSTTRLSPAIYVLVVEAMCRTPPSSPLFARGAQMLSKCPFPTLSDELATALEQRDLVPLLGITRTSDNETKRYFAKGQLWLLLSLYIYAGDTASGRGKLKMQLDKWRRNSNESEVERHRGLGLEVWRPLSRGSSMIRDLGIWAYRLDECTSQFLPDSFHYSNEIANVPLELRGLSSFTAWPRRADNPSTNETRLVERTEDEVGRLADATDSTTRGGGATGGDDHSPSFGLAADTEEAGTQGMEDVGRADSSQDHEAAAQGLTGEAGDSLARANRQGDIGEVQCEGNSEVEAVGDERTVADEGVATRMTGRPQSEVKEAEAEDVVRVRRDKGDAVIEMDRLESPSDRPVSRI